jgi:hypothetical protein
MKKQSTITLVLGLVLTIAVGYLFYKNEADNDYWNNRIERYMRTSDSLQHGIHDIELKLYKKDSIMLSYMSSLDKTLQELNKESAKNKQIVRENFSRQDSIRLNYCREMEKLQQKPDGCQ